MPRPLQASRRGREARRAAGGRLSRRAAGDLAVRKHGEAHDHALPQLPRHGDGGADPLAARRRRRADGRLRQDHARPHPRRDQRRRSVDLRAGRPAAARQLARQDTWLGLGCLEVLGRAPRRQPLRQGLGGDADRAQPLLRRLHDHGHRLHHDGPCRRARHESAGRVLHPGARQ